MTTISLGKDEVFDDLVHKSLPSGDTLRVATKDAATREGRPGIVLSFDVRTPDGDVHRVQFATTVREIAAVYSALRGRYGPGGPESHRYPGLESPFIPYPDTTQN